MLGSGGARSDINTTKKMPAYKYKGQTFSLKWALALMKKEGAQRVTKNNVPRNTRKRRTTDAG